MDTNEAHDTLMRMLDIYTRPMIGVAVRLGIPDILAERETTAEELAATMSQHPGALSRMMRGLSARGVFRELSDGRYGLTPLSELLRDGVPNSLRPAALWRTTDRHPAEHPFGGGGRSAPPGHRACASATR